MFLPVLLALVVAVRRRDAVLVGALFVTGAAAIVATSMLPVPLLVALPGLASWASGPVVLSYIESRRALLVTGSAVGLAALTVTAGLALTHVGQPDPAKYSISLVGAIPEQCRLFNSSPVGGFVILERPDVLVSIDSREEDVYGDSRVRDSDRALTGSDMDQLAGAGCALIPPDTGLAQRLGRDEDWARVGEEKSAVLFVRR